MTKTTKKSASGEQSALKAASDMLTTGLGGLETYIEKTAKTVSESSDVEAATLFAHLLTKVAQVTGELRKAEAAERKASSEMSRGEVVEWFRSMADGDQQRFLRELTQQTKKGSGLA